MNFSKRLAALERRLIFEPITLFFEDGTSTQICGRDEHILRLFDAAARGERSREMDLIVRSVRAEEPGGGHLVELTRALLLSPDE